MTQSKIGTCLTLIIYGVMFSLPSSAITKHIKESNSSGELKLFDKEGNEHSSLLLSAEVSLDVTAMTARVTLKQKFTNPTKRWLNARYLFPLPETAAVHAMTLTVGDRVIKGVIQERRKAEKIFKQAKMDGKKAALVESQRSNLFTLSAANIAPGEEVEVSLTYLQTVDYQHGEFSLRLPTTLTPRYIPGVELLDEADRGANIKHNNYGWQQRLDTDEVPDASKISAHQVYDLEQSHFLTFKARLDPGMRLESINSPSHALDWQQIKNQYQISFSRKSEKLDRDLVLNWKPVILEQPHSALFYEEIDGRVYASMMLMPPTVKSVSILPRDVIFVIDSSGSMQGASMPQARQSLELALNRLQEKDKFNIIDFDSEARKLFSDSQPVNNVTLMQAREFVRDLQADGGTNMMAALDLALKNSLSMSVNEDDVSIETRLRQIIFITDGSVGNEAALFNRITTNLGSSRLFTVGIGSSPNSLFMRKAAEFGRGTFTPIDPGGNIEKRMSALFSQLEKPTLRDVIINWPASAEVEQLPEKIPDLYFGQPLVVTAQLKHKVDKISISGQLAGKKWQRSLIAGEAIEDSGLATLWARKKIDTLLDSLIAGSDESTIKKEVTALAVRHQLLSRYTSFIAVETTRVKPVDVTASDTQLPNLIPAGNKLSVAYPATATSAKLSFILGMMLLLLAAIIFYRQKLSAQARVIEND